MAGEFALVGGEEFRSGCEEMDIEIMKASGQEPARVLIIPTAAITGPAKAANDGVNHFAKLGGDSSQLMVLDRSQSDDPSFVQFGPQSGREPSVVYFTGGNPDHLLTTLADSQLLRNIMDAVADGAVLAGSSAGAMVMGSLMRRPQGGGWIEALGVVPGLAVLPHHERSDPRETSRQLRTQVPADLTVLGIDARSGCLGRPGSWRTVGTGNVTVYRGADWQVYSSGQALPSDV